MASRELESESESVERAVDLLDQLLATADGGRNVGIGQYEATAIIALLMDKKHRVKVLSRLDDFDCADT